MIRLLTILLLVSCLSLGSPINVVIDAKPFHQVIELISIGTRTNIVVNWTELELWGIDKDDEISIRLHDVTFEKLLSIVLNQVGDGEVDIGYAMDDGIMYISTKADLDSKIKTKVYDIRDLLLDIPIFRGRQISLDNIGQNNQQGGIGGGRFLNGGGGGGGSGSGNLFNGGNNDDEEIEATATIESLIDLIRNTIDPESWRQSGGISGISTLNSQIIVTQTSSAHKQLRDL